MISFVQTANSGTPTGPASSVSATFSLPQSSGNLNLVVINFGALSGSFTANIASVIDTLGNNYLAASPLSRMEDGTGEGDSIITYYASNVAYGFNTVTVTVSSPSDFFAIAVLEYSGIALSSPLDVTDINISSGPVSTINAVTASITTTNANDLIIGAFCLFDGPVAGDPSYSIRSSFYTILVEDKIVSSIGSYTAIATSAHSAGWIGQIIAFKDSSASVSQYYAIISDDRSSVLTVMTMTPSLKANMLANNPQLILLPVNMIAKPSFSMATQAVIQSGWIIGPVDVQPEWVVISQTTSQMVASAAQLYFDTVMSGMVVNTFTSALANWGAQTTATKDLLLFKLLDSVNAILQCKFGIAGLQLNGSVQVAGFLSLGLGPQLTGALGISGVLTL